MTSLHPCPSNTFKTQMLPDNISQKSSDAYLHNELSLKEIWKRWKGFPAITTTTTTVAVLLIIDKDMIRKVITLDVITSIGIIINDTNSIKRLNFIKIIFDWLLDEQTGLQSLMLVTEKFSC